MTAPLRIDGVDLSHHNPVTLEGLKLAKAAGVKFVYHKATEGTTYTDPTFRERRGLCERAGIPFGGYHFAWPEKGDAKAEAEAFLKTFSVFRPGRDLRPMLDLEERGRLDRNELSDWAADWVAVVSKAAGVTPVIYTPFDLDATAVRGCPLWVARYSNGNLPPRIPEPWSDWFVRQFSNGEYGVPKVVPGLGFVDLNTLHDPADWRKLLIPAPAPVVNPKPPTRPNRVVQARRLILEGLQLLDAAVADGRKGWVKIGAGMIRAGYNRLPKE